MSSCPSRFHRLHALKCNPWGTLSCLHKHSSEKRKENRKYVSLVSMLQQIYQNGHHLTCFLIHSEFFFSHRIYVNEKTLNLTEKWRGKCALDFAFSQIFTLLLAWRGQKSNTRLFNVGAFFFNEPTRVIHFPWTLTWHACYTLSWWRCYGLCLWHEPTELAHSFLFCSGVYFCLYCAFNCISVHKSSQQLSAFSFCSSGLISALLVLSAI